jgi:hypothetical protein
MLAPPLARWLAAWAGLIGWLAGWTGWAGWLTCAHDLMTMAFFFSSIGCFLDFPDSGYLSSPLESFPYPESRKSGERFPKRGGRTEGGKKQAPEEGLTTFVFPTENSNFPRCAAPRAACIIT